MGTQRYLQLRSSDAGDRQPQASRGGGVQAHLAQQASPSLGKSDKYVLQLLRIFAAVSERPACHGAEVMPADVRRRPV